MTVLQRSSARALPLVNRAAEHAPLATACCNACRTCVTTNALAALTAGATAAGLAIARLATRVVKRA